MGWTLDIQDAKGNTTVATDVVFHGARLTWDAEGFGACEVDLKQGQMSDVWQSGKHRLIAKLDGTPKWAGMLTKLGRSGEPGGPEWKASGLGLGVLLESRIVRFPFVITDTVDAIVSALLDEIQVTQINGDLGFSMGTATGTFATRTRSYCTGAKIAEEIRELAQKRQGFDWEVDATGAINLWTPKRGVSTGLTIGEDDTHTWDVESDTDDMLTNVTVLGDFDDPYQHRVMARKDGMTALFARHEEAIEVTADDDNELYDAGFAVLRARLGSMTTLTTSWLEGRGPWAFGQVWLQDEVSAELESWFGGTQDMRCSSVVATLDGNELVEVEQSFDALVVDADIINDDEDVV